MKYDKKIILIILRVVAIVTTVSAISLSIIGTMQVFKFVPWGWVSVIQHMSIFFSLLHYILPIGFLSCFALLFIKRRSLVWGLFASLGSLGLLVITIVSLCLKSKASYIPFSDRKTFQKIGIILMYFTVVLSFITTFIPATKFITFVSYGFKIPTINKGAMPTIDDELLNVKSDYALIIPSQGIDEYPLWSEDGKFVYAMVEGSWMKLNLGRVHLTPGTWRGDMPIGVNDNPSSLKPAKEDQKTMDFLISKNKHDAEDLTLPSGTKLEFKQPGFYSEFIMTKPGEKPKTLWETDLELCYYLILSPNKKYLLFKCELNGVVLMKVDKI